MTRESLIAPPPPSLPPPPERIKHFFRPPPFSSWKRRKLSRPSRLSGVIFHLAFFEAAENLKGRRYSSLVSVPSPNWGRFRCGSALRPPGTRGFVLPGSHRVSRPGLKLQELFFFSTFPPFFFIFALFANQRCLPQCTAAVGGYFFQPVQPSSFSATNEAPAPHPPLTPPLLPPRVTTLISPARNLAGSQSRRNHRWIHCDERRGEEGGRS